MAVTQKTEEQNLQKVGKDNGGKPALFKLKDTAALWDLSNRIWLLCLTLSKFAVKLNIVERVRDSEYLTTSAIWEQ